MKVETAFFSKVLTARWDGEPDATLDDEMVSGLHDAIAEAEAKGAAVLHLRSGARSFCAGADAARLKAWIAPENGPSEIVKDSRAWTGLFERLDQCGPTVLAEIDGAVLGAGVGLALACDLRIASDRCVMGVPEARFGVLPAGSTIQRLVATTSTQLSRRLLVTGEVVKADEALRLGLVDWVVPAAEIAERAQQMASRVSRLSVPAVTAAKAVIRSIADGPEAAREAEEHALSCLVQLSETRASLQALANPAAKA
ncbi:enoyl-CoA hydratase/carnithine racemase [Rhodoligotrophos appendicifer]|uniref:enoyl-CoA hydratase/isomerase family protein n=1 Tax=Rhodoligotrophos appendicifer TaxID=987056 RepID=UPI0011868887|nr:enoyl-CoA hydratase/isomerase family protein [Rhodoligotrophos appendicifer]